MQSTVKCEICKKEFKSITKTHLKYKHKIDFDEYMERFPNSPIKSELTLSKMKEKMTGREIKWKDKIASAVKKSYDENPEGWGKTGYVVSDETKKIVSKKMMGRIITKEARLKISKTMETKHISKTDPEKWQRTLQQQMKTRLKNGSLYYSIAERYAYRYISKYFSFFYNINIIDNNNKPFETSGKNFSIDMAIPKYKIAIEWDGEWHRKVVIERERGEFYKKVFIDFAKNMEMKKEGWKVVRVRYSSQKHRRDIPKACRKICRKLIKEKLVPLVLDEEFRKNWKNEYTMTKEEFQKIREEYHAYKSQKITV